jgi:hypothetical protein
MPEVQALGKRCCQKRVSDGAVYVPPASCLFFSQNFTNGMLAGLVSNLLSGVPRMSEMERLRELAAYYSLLAFG